MNKKLNKVLKEIQQQNIPGHWFISGSVGRELKGISTKHNDINIKADEKTLNLFKHLIKTGIISRDFPIDLEKKKDDYIWFTFIERNNGLNVLSLENQLSRYETIEGRQWKAEQIRNFLNRRKLK